MTPAGVRAALAKAPGITADQAVLSPLPGGITNKNFRVDAPEGVFVLRIDEADAEALGIDRERERATLEAAFGLGLGPEVVFCLPAAGILLTRFIPGECLDAAAASQPLRLERIAAALRRLHGAEPIPGEFSPFAVVRRYHETARARGVNFPPRLTEALVRMEAIESALGSPARPAPCHNDLLAANLIDDGAIRVIDWEYAGMGDPMFDLGNLAANLELDRDGSIRLLEAYGTGASAAGIARLSLMRLASDLREAMWGVLQSGSSRIAFDFSKYAREHLDRFLSASAGSVFSGWLKDGAMPRVT